MIVKLEKKKKSLVLKRGDRRAKNSVEKSVSLVSSEIFQTNNWGGDISLRPISYHFLLIDPSTPATKKTPATKVKKTPLPATKAKKRKQSKKNPEKTKSYPRVTALQMSFLL